MIGRSKDTIAMKRIDRTLFIAFITIETALYLGFLWMDVVGRFTNQSTILKFLGIVLCFLYALLRVEKKNQDTILMTFALFFTVCADVCLLLTDYYNMGLLFFCMVQVIYFIRIRRYDQRKISSALGLRGAFFGLVLILIFFLEIPVDVLLILTMFYFINICSNTIASLRANRIDERSKGEHSKHQWKLYTVGMVLFLLCDINVGIYNISSYLPLENSFYQRIYSIAMIAMWFFYLPAQVLIAKSSGLEK